MNETKKGGILVLGDQDYWLDKVIKKSGTGPLIDLDVKNMHPLEHDHRSPELEVKVLYGTEEAYDGILVYKHFGKFTVLLGRERVEKALKNKERSFKNVRLISHPMLKECRKDTPVIFQQPAAAPTPAPASIPAKQHPREFANTPRIVGHRAQQ